MIKKILNKYILKRQDNINLNNRKRLTNYEPTLICINCTGGFLYHWLGLQFCSPFINLYMDGNDFITALENWDDFLNTEIKEVFDPKYSYPVGESIFGVKIHFMHYDTFKNAISAWNRRKNRINRDNMAIMFTNVISSVEGNNILERFDKLPFENKVIFVDELHITKKIKSAVYLKGFKRFKKIKAKRSLVANIYNTQNYITGKRFIDQFDYVSFINGLKKNES